MTQRRTILRAAAAAGLATFTGIVPGLHAIAANPPRVRRCVNDMKLDDPDIETYRDFVGLMLRRKETDPVSWIGFANQHGDADEPKFCPHGDWYFLPWHREYMLMYERAAAALTKNPKFAMPYWDWTALRDYPPAFSAPTYKGKPNPLFVKGRNALVGDDALTDAIVGPEVMQEILRETVYEAFGTSRNPDQDDLDPKWVPLGGGDQGTLEATPHNLVHNSIGAFMPELNSPRDPIFFMHHGNIDRIWAGWNALGRKNSSDPLWLRMNFKDNYITPKGKTYSCRVRDLQDIAALGYTYDRLPRPTLLQAASPRHTQNMGALFDPAQKVRPPRIRKENSTAARPGAPLSVPFEIKGGGLLGASAQAAEARELVALIRDVRVGPAVKEIRVFVNHPAPTRDTPETDPHFVARLAFLKHPEGHAGHKKLPSAQVNLTRALRRLPKASDGSESITVQLLPVLYSQAAPGASGEVVPAAVEVAIL